MINNLNANFSSNVLTIYTPRLNRPFYADGSAPIKLSKINAIEVPSGFSGWLLRLDPTRVSLNISDKNAQMVSVKINDLANILGTSWLQVFILRLISFIFFERIVQHQLISKNIHQVLSHLANQQASTSVVHKGLKLSKKKIPYLPHSFLVIRDQKELSFHQKVKQGGKDYIIGKGGFKKAKRLMDIQANKKMALVTPHSNFTEMNRKKFEHEMKLNETLKDIPHVAQGRKVSWVSSKGVVKEGILMPEYSGTMRTTAHTLSFQAKKTCAAQIATALKKLMDKELFHLDLKPDNVFIECQENGEVSAYIADLGGIREYSSVLSDLGNTIKGLFGASKKQNNMKENEVEFTYQYAAPELLTKQKKIMYDKDSLKKAVIYSLGKTLLEWFKDHQLNMSLARVLKNATESQLKHRPHIQTIIDELTNQRVN